MYPEVLSYIRRLLCISEGIKEGIKVSIKERIKEYIKERMGIKNE